MKKLNALLMATAMALGGTIAATAPASAQPAPPPAVDCPKNAKSCREAPQPPRDQKARDQKSQPPRGQEERNAKPRRPEPERAHSARNERRAPDLREARGLRASEKRQLPAPPRGREYRVVDDRVVLIDPVTMRIVQEVGGLRSLPR